MSAAAIVQRDDCRGMKPYECVNCGEAMGKHHWILCYLFGQKIQAERREAEGTCDE